MYRVSQKISVQHPTITRLPEKGVEPKMTQQKYVLQVTRVIAIVELASNKIQPVPKKNALNSKCVETEWMQKQDSTIANLESINQKKKQEFKKL